MPTKKRTNKTDPEGLSYEKAVEALEELIEQIEEGSIGLEESVEAYRKGTSLIRRCRSILEKTEQEVETLDAALADSEESDS